MGGYPQIPAQLQGQTHQRAELQQQLKLQQQQQQQNPIYFGSDKHEQKGEGEGGNKKNEQECTHFRF